MKNGMLLMMSALALPWPVTALATLSEPSPFILSSRGSKLAILLADLGAHHGTPVIASPLVDDTFIGTLSPGGLEQTLRRLSSQYQLIWYHDGQAIHVYKAREAGSRLITPSQPVATLHTQLTEARLLDPQHCRAHAVETSNTLEVLGAPACIERVAGFIERIDTRQRRQDQEQVTVRLFPLKYATAADVDYSSRGKQLRIPGVVAMLKDMVPADAPAGEGSLPRFSAYAPQNAVMVRDRQANIPLYARLIEQLDHRPALIDISVTLIDINSEDLGALGIDWSASMGLGNAAIRFNGGGQPDTGNFSTVIADTAHFMLRLSALEQRAKAHILSRPSVVTLNNMPAILDRNVTFHTKLTADRFARLETISTGSLLHVTPRLIKGDAQTEIMLALQIQDGRQTEAISRQEPLPQTLNAEISTQALLKAGQSLLLGGFLQDENVESQRKIPFLGDIPLLGNLFSSTSKNARQTVRLFLIKAEPSSQS